MKEDVGLICWSRRECKYGTVAILFPLGDNGIGSSFRIGQTRRVFAYRLITRDTVEEKVLTLQGTKRELADALINENNSVLRNITGEDLMLLLS